MANRLVRAFRAITAKIPEQNRASVACCLFVGGLCLNTTIYEYSDMHGTGRDLFLTLKGSASLLFFVNIVTLIRWPHARWNNYLFATASAAYAITGSYYRSLYIVALFDCLIVFIFIFPLTAREFWVTATTSLGLYTVLLISRFPKIPESSQALTLPDHITMSFERFTVLIFAFYFFIRAKNYQLAAQQRLGLLGRHAARVAHDLKGTLAGPLLMMNLAQERAGGGEHLIAIESQMQRIHEALAELSRLCSLDQLPSTRFTLSQALKGAALLYFKSLHDVEVTIEGDVEFVCDRSLVTSVLTNLLSNSMAAFVQRKSGDRKITLTVPASEPLKIVYRDTAGGFTTEALAAITRGDPYSTSGNGIGISLIKDGMTKLSGQAVFESENKGAKVTLAFSSLSPVSSATSAHFS